MKLWTHWHLKQCQHLKKRINKNQNHTTNNSNHLEIKLTEDEGYRLKRIFYVCLGLQEKYFELEIKLFSNTKGIFKIVFSRKHDFSDGFGQLKLNKASLLSSYPYHSCKDLSTHLILSIYAVQWQKKGPSLA